MTEPTARFRRLQALFGEAIELDAAARPAWLSALVDSDAALKPELLRLLERDAADAGQPTRHPHAVIGALLDEALSPLPERIGRFEIIGELGRGGMGRVLHGIARDSGIEQHAAIKVLRADVWDPAGESRLQEEARTLAGLDHPGIARLLEAGRSAEGIGFVAMERVDGDSLMSWCAQRGLGLRERIELFLAILSAVAHAHRALIVHRDIKPANVMVDREGRTRLLDFGLARIQQHELDQHTQTAARFFTPAYAAPEQVRGERITIACDLYALGALLYELLSGASPFELDGRTAGEAERLILEVPPEPMEQAYRQRAGARQRIGREDAPSWERRLRGDLECIVQKALRKEPLARYLSVEAFEQDLQRWLGLRPVRARRGHLLYRAQKFVQRNRGAVAAGVLALAGMGFASQQVIEHARVAERERDRAVAALALLNDAFVAADPTQSSDGETSVRAVLEAAALRVGRLLPGQPQLHAELAAQISEIRSALGILEEDGLLAAALASTQLEPALRLRLQLAAAREDVLAQRISSAAERLDALALAFPGDPRIDLVAAQRWLVDLEAEPALELLRSLPQRLESAAQPALARKATQELARALRMAGLLDEALQLLDAQIAVLSDDAELAQARLNRVDVLIGLERFDEAAADISPLHALMQSRFGERSAMIASLHTRHALLLHGQKRFSDAATEFQSAARVYASALGDHHLNAARARFNAAELMATVDPSDTRADAEYEAAIDAASRARSATDPLPLYFRASYARGLLARGDISAARRHLLPEQGELDVRSLSSVNRDALRALIIELHGSMECATAAGSEVDAASLRARAVYCAAEADPALHPQSVPPSVNDGAVSPSPRTDQGVASQ